MRRIFSATIVIIFLAGCASTFRQSEALLANAPPDLPPATQLIHVPFIEQPEGFCGPATLTMAMQSAGQSVTLDQLATEVYTPSSKGTLQSDLISASRRHGMLAVSLGNLRDVLKEVAAGHPVIVFENLGLSWYPIWHYALITGYDLANKEIILHSGSDAFQREDLRRFEHAWNLGGYWALVVLPPAELSASANELAHVAAASGLEQANRHKEAELAYQTILERWPWSVASLIGLGNVTYKKGDMYSALAHLKRATKLDPASEVARHNLEVVRRKIRY